MDAVTRIGGKIDKVVKNLYHPKTELVDLVAKLNKWAAVFKRESLKAWMEAHKYEPVEKAMTDVDTQADVEQETETSKRKAKTRNIGCQIDFTSKDNVGNKKNAEKKDMACQTEPRPRDGRLQEEIKNARTLEEFEKVKGLNWTETQFENVKIVVRNPIMSREEAVAKCVIVEPDDGAMDKSIQKM
jgi:hypothetical protein